MEGLMKGDHDEDEGPSRVNQILDMEANEEDDSILCHLLRMREEERY
jgi:hypothetical protein